MTTAAWLRGILQNEYDVDLDTIRWVTFEDPHVAEYHDPATAERAPDGKQLVKMLFDGEIDAGIVGAPDLKDARLQPIIPNPIDAAQAWCRKHGALPINHMLVVKESLRRSNPWVVQKIHGLLRESKQAAPLLSGVDPIQFGVETIRPSLDLIIEYSAQQKLIPRRFAVDELFDDLTRVLN